MNDNEITITLSENEVRALTVSCRHSLRALLDHGLSANGFDNAASAEAFVDAINAVAHKMRSAWTMSGNEQAAP